MHFEMEDLIEQANEVQESMSRTYGVPDEVDEADLEAGALPVSRALSASHPKLTVSSLAELDALGDDWGEEEEAIPSYLREDVSELPDFVDEAPVTETVGGRCELCGAVVTITDLCPFLPQAPKERLGEGVI